MTKGKKKKRKSHLKSSVNLFSIYTKKRCNGLLYFTVDLVVLMSLQKKQKKNMVIYRYIITSYNLKIKLFNSKNTVKKKR